MKNKNITIKKRSTTMSKKKTFRFSNWNEIANDRDDFRNNSETYEKSYESINIVHTFGHMIKLKEYNKSLIKLCQFLGKDENKHIIKTLSKQDKDFYFLDLGDLWFHVRQLTTVGLEEEKNVDDWTVFSFGHVGRKSQQDKDVN